MSDDSILNKLRQLKELTYLARILSTILKLVFDTLWWRQDVSDLLEKEPEQSEKVRQLESNAVMVIRRDWQKHVTEALRTGTLTAVPSIIGL